jgi:glucosamine--fructose-6-phosphate aminotransferase (isomerizing)
MIAQKLKSGCSIFEAIHQVTLELRGTFALAIINRNEPDTMVIAKRGSPLVVGLGNDQFEGDIFTASDTFALSNYISSCAELDDDEICVIKKDGDNFGCNFFNISGEKIEKNFKKFEEVSVFCGKGDYDDFTSKEINEQPEIANKLIESFKTGRFVETIRAVGPEINRINFVACGSSFYAGLVGKYILEKYCEIQVSAEIASEFRYKSPLLDEKTLNVFISQSGETLDTLYAQTYVKQRGFKTFVITNAPQSTMAKAADFVFDLGAGPELSVVSTKAFTAQLMSIVCIMMEISRQRGADIDAFLQDLESVPALVSDAIEYFGLGANKKAAFDGARSFVQILSEAKSVLFIGRNLGYPVALENALKFKEISYIHAEGYAAGELKHGPIALIDESVVTVVIAPCDELIEKILSNVQEIIARNGIVVLVTDADGARLAEWQEINKKQLFVCLMPKTGVLSKLFVYSVVGQLIAYKVAKLQNRDVDRPRNLAKAVTVE